MTAADVVLDASAIVRGLTARDSQFHRAVSGASRLLAPDLIGIEITNALLGYVRSGSLSRDEVGEALRRFIMMPVEYFPSSGLAEPSLDAALATGLSAYDASYLVVARANDALLVTADGRLAEAHERSELVQ